MSLHNFIGIDLGTTNSVMAFGNVNADGIVEPEVASYLSTDLDGRSGRQELFPSCVYYKQNEEPIAGDKALSMSGRQSKRVIRSVKSSMGTSRVYNIDGKVITPAEVSAVILRQLINADKEYISADPNYVIDDVVITIPASFTDDQQEDTREAARRADIRTENADKTPRLFLLEEPRAALYDFINRQERGKIPPTLIDFSTPKTVLVFDLGGGTLDISIHSVGSINGRTDVIEDYAVSPHTLLGGDDFDRMLRKYLIERFNSMNRITLRDEYNDDAATQIALNDFLDAAERGKRLLNTAIDLRLRSGTFDYDSVSAPFRRLHIYGNYDLDCQITASEYRTVISPLLGNGITLDILKDSRKSREYFINPSNRDTIIYPLLATIQNAKKRINEKLRRDNKPELKDDELPKIDAVLLNGGMTRLFAVRERLREFFGFEPVSAGDPEFAVARGAVVYHYKMHLGEHVSRIRNADIGLQQRDGTLKKLITAGTTLPYSTEFEAFTTIDNAESVDLPFYVGAGDSINDSRCKPIAIRSVRFMNGSMPKDTPIKLRASFDEMGVLTVNSGEFDAPVKVDVKQREDMPAKRTPVIARKNPPALLLPGTKRQDTAYYIRRYKVECENWHKMELNGDIELTRKNREATMANETIIEEAANSYEAIPRLIELIDQRIARVSKRSIKMLGNIVIRWHNKGADNRVINGIMKLHDICANLDPNISISENEFAVDSLARLCRPEDESMFVKYLNQNYASRIWSNGYLVKFCNALARTGHTPEAVNALGKYIDYHSRGVKISAYWALGRVGSRERNNPIPAKYFESILPFMLSGLRRESHGEAARNGIYALGEICDQRFKEVSCVSEDIVDEAEDVIDVLINRSFGRSSAGVERYAATSLAMMKGEKLSAEQEMHLLEVRESA